ncbi:hypothetical protein E4U57_004082 [Claviceps arundinis]|uniref:Uncharacterized protein n=1 Tax=Claviceps arundinis TaxID=1623583 RepID=A0A9P7SST6_9HYPO|nr:hypothetical protein E4U57_004082 [Claviceps arundinis]KAG5972575.1 hypothetical protein E4U56_005903 [Claviceps arundinis]
MPNGIVQKPSPDSYHGASDSYCRLNLSIFSRVCLGSDLLAQIYSLSKDPSPKTNLGQELGTLQFRHAAVGIGRRFVSNNFAKDYYKDETGDVEEPEVAIEDPLEMSAVRGSAVGARRYAVWSDLVEHLTQDNMDAFRPLDQSWHRFLGLNSWRGDLQPNHQRRKGAEMEATLAKKTKSTATPVASTVVPTILLRQTQSPPLYELNVAEYTHTPPISSSSTVPSRQSKLQRPNSQQQEDRALRKALGLADPAPVAYKSPEQEQALKRIMNDTDPALVVVLSTGGGTASMPWATASLKISAMS